jgi:hypothetical protein
MIQEFQIITLAVGLLATTACFLFCAVQSVRMLAEISTPNTESK